MKIFIILLGLLMATGSVFGKIKNGYAKDLEGNVNSLRRLKSMLSSDKDLSAQKKGEIRMYIEELTDIISYYELTERLIFQLQTVSPDTYNELNTIKDKKGRLTDIYVRVIPKENTKLQLQAASFFYQSAKDEDAIFSEYGEYSVSVDVWLMDNSLFLLCHELGHINYVIPNLASYTKFYRRTYRSTTKLSSVGHNRRDQSGKSANIFGKKLLEDESRYKAVWGKKPESALVIIYKIRIQNRHLGQEGLPIRSGALANSADWPMDDPRPLRKPGKQKTNELE